MQINENSNGILIINDKIFDSNRFIIFHKLITIKLMKVNINSKFWSDILLLLKDVFNIDFFKSKCNSYHISFLINKKTNTNTQKNTLYMDVFDALDFYELDFMALVHVAYEYADFFDNFIFRFLY
ncbi:hypothetical protein GVAV_001228 [Gurleya vavrai]